MDTELKNWSHSRSVSSALEAECSAIVHPVCSSEAGKNMVSVGERARAQPATFIDIDTYIKYVYNFLPTTRQASLNIPQKQA